MTRNWHGLNKTRRAWRQALATARAAALNQKNHVPLPRIDASAIARAHEAKRAYRYSARGMQDHADARRNVPITLPKLSILKDEQ